jgi:hypothetical protein
MCVETDKKLRSVSFDKINKEIYICFNNSILIIHSSTGKPTRIIVPHNSSINHIKYYPAS